MKSILPIAKLFNKYLFIHPDDLPHLGKALDLKCIRVDFDSKKIDEIWELERHFKFNSWEIIEDQKERDAVLELLKTEFSEQEIADKIITPLEENKIK